MTISLIFFLQLQDQSSRLLLVLLCRAITRLWPSTIIVNFSQHELVAFGLGTLNRGYRVCCQLTNALATDL